MKAIVLNQPKNFAVKEIELPELKEDEVLIRIKDSGICTNDVRDFNGDCSYSYPRIGGHEYCGVIEELGNGVNEKRYSKGQKVVQYIIDDCKECFFCKHGEENICEEHPKSKIFTNPDGLSGYGGFAEFVVAKAEDLFVYPDSTTFEKMAFTEPLACVVNSITRTNIQFGDDVAVIGGGTMGMLHVMLARLKGARVILSEPLRAVSYTHLKPIVMGTCKGTCCGSSRTHHCGSSCSWISSDEQKTNYQRSKRITC